MSAIDKETTMNYAILLLSIALTFNPINAIADIKTDMSAGNCIALFAVQQKMAGMKDALAMADNQNRAIKFSSLKLNELERYKNDKSMITSLIFSMTSDCRNIGIRSSNY